jgi:integrating conjugative element membrane protein (TIGR03745 family)
VDSPRTTDGSPSENPVKTRAKFGRLAIALGSLAAVATRQGGAALPTPVAPSTAPRAGDWIGLIEGYIKDGGLVLGFAIAVLGFLRVAYLTFAKFNEARQGKAEWAEVGVLGIVGAIVLVFVSFLLTEAAGRFCHVERR